MEKIVTVAGLIFIIIGILLICCNNRQLQRIRKADLDTLVSRIVPDNMRNQVQENLQDLNLSGEDGELNNQRLIEVQNEARTQYGAELEEWDEIIFKESEKLDCNLD